MKKGFAFIIVIIVLALIGIQVMSVNSTPIIKAIADKEVTQFCQLVVNHTTFTYDNLSQEVLKIERNSDGKISIIDFDMARISSMSGDLVLQVEELLLQLEEGTYQKKDDSVYARRLKKINDAKGVIASMPLGMLTNNPFFASMGPSLKIKYQTLAHVSSSVEKEIKNYGINRIMISINIVLNIKLMVLAPFYKEEYVQKVTFPLLLEIIEGEVPNWYQN